MAVYPTFSVADLVKFSGRDEEEYPEEYTATALTNALMWFQIATCRKDPNSFPDDAFNQNLVRNAVMDMAENMILNQPHRIAQASPYSSETIGSYSYSKKVQAKIEAGETTGVMWFDLAVKDLSLCHLNGKGMDFGGVEVFGNDGTFFGDGRVTQWVGPAPRGGYPL